jgi:hypothetical protein
MCAECIYEQKKAKGRGEGKREEGKGKEKVDKNGKSRENREEIPQFCSTYKGLHLFMIRFMYKYMYNILI